MSDIRSVVMDKLFKKVKEKQDLKNSECLNKYNRRKSYGLTKEKAARISLNTKEAYMGRFK